MWRRRILPAVVLLTATLPACVSSGADEYGAAGIVVYSRIQDRTYVLLADHRDSNRGWGAFGGGREGSESAAMTASREFHEETRCVYEYPSPADLSAKPSVSGPGFLSYVIEIPFVPAQVFESKPASADCRGPEFNERGPWVWIPLNDLVGSLENPDSTGGYAIPIRFVPQGSTTKIWGASAAILKQAVSKGLLKE